LDRAVYREILETAKKLTGVDQKMAQEVIGIELDAVNIKIILKGKELAVSPEIIKDYLMPTAFFNEEILEGVIEAVDAKSIMEHLSKIVGSAHPVYKKIFTQIVKESNAPLSRLEAILDKAPLEMSLSTLKEHSRYYHLGFILSFLNLKWAEVKNLRCIVEGSERKSPHSQVRKLLAIPDEWQPSQLSCSPS
jgi:vacuolar-type H+-ATPase subunit C/Vma6